MLDVAAVLAKVRRVVPAQFLKTADNFRGHKKLLHNPLLNNLLLHDMLGGGMADDAMLQAGCLASSPPASLDRVQNATRAVQLMQRTAAMSGLARAFSRRASLNSKSGCSGAVNRLHNPLAALAGAPGGEVGRNTHPNWK